MSGRKFLSFLLVFFCFAFAWAFVIPSSAYSATTGTIYFTQIGNAVFKATFTEDTSVNPPSFTLGTPVQVSGSLPGGADGIVFDPQNGNLLVGVNGGGPAQVNIVDPTTGAFTGTITTDGQTASHLMVDPSGLTAWATADPGVPVSIALNPQGSGVAHTLTGDDQVVNTIAWKDSSHAYYTSDNGCFCGNGHFGTIDLSTFSTDCVKDVSGSCETFAAAHGMTYDPFSDSLILFGGSTITQIDATTLTVLASINTGFGNLDQGTVDGHGHLFVASNNGQLFFDDYSGAAGGVINGSGSHSYSPFLINSLDDIAPQYGAGSQNPPTGVPEFPVTTLGPLLLIALVLPALLLVGRKNRAILPF